MPQPPPPGYVSVTRAGVQPPPGFTSVTRASDGKEKGELRSSLPELPPPLRGLSPDDALTAARGEGRLVPRWADPNAQLSQDNDGNQTLIMNGQEYYFNRPGLSGSDVGRTIRGVTGAIEEVAPYLHTGVAAAPLRALPAMVAQAGTGIVEEGADQIGNAIRGEGFDWSEIGKQSLIAAAGEGGGRMLVAGLSPLLRRIAGRSVPVLNEDGALTDDAIRVLNNGGVTPGQADDAVSQYIRESDTLSPAAAERFNLFQKYGMTGSRAQVHRTADLFLEQEELAKRSGPFRSQIEGQNAQVASLMDDALPSGGGTGVYEAISSKALQLDDQISQLYKAADEAVNGGRVIRLESLAENLNRFDGQDRLTNGLVRAMRSELRRTGVINKKGQVVGRIDARQAEDVRKLMNKLYDSTTDRGRQLIRTFKNAIDDDVFSAAGDDIYAQARQAKANFEAGLRRTKLNKFDTRDRSLVRDVLENRVRPDEFFDKAVLNRGWNADDLAEVKSYLQSGSPEQISAGQDAWDTLRKETMDWIKEQAFKNAATGENEVSYLSADKLWKATQRIGTDRMKVLFTQEENKFIADMVKLARYRTPVRGTGGGKGPTGMAVEELRKALPASTSRIPLISGWIDNIVTARDGRIMLDPARETVRAFSRAQAEPMRRGLRGLGASGAIYAEDR